MNIKEVCRYLGYKSAMPHGETLKQIDDAVAELHAIIHPKSVFEKYDCIINGETTTIGSLTIKSKQLAKHLEGCQQLALLAVTLGVSADTYIRKCNIENMAKAVIASAVCAVMCEELCDDLMLEIKKTSSYFLTPRFSPGYGDFALSYQKDMLTILNCNKTIGLTLTESFMLVPTKSVTAVIGFTESETCNTQKCKNCKNVNCEFREENTNGF